MRTIPTNSRLPIVLLLLLTPVLAQAHPGFHASGFLHGVEHPISGLDHICAMLAVGLWGAQRGGRAIWALPVTFLSMMLAGGLLAKSGIFLPQVELGIALSVLILGLLITAAAKLPFPISAAIVGVFALFHGYAHAAETPMNVSDLTYGIGFLLSTAALHLAGIGLGVASGHFGKAPMIRYAGGAIALCGVFLLAS